MEMIMIVKVEYEKTFFNLEKMQNEITDNLIIEFKDNGKRLVTYNQKQVAIDDNKIDELINKIIDITNYQGAINEYIDDCGAKLKISYNDKNIEEYDRGFDDGQTDIGTLLDDFIDNNIKDD